MKFRRWLHRGFDGELNLGGSLQQDCRDDGFRHGRTDRGHAMIPRTETGARVKSSWPFATGRLPTTISFHLMASCANVTHSFAP